MGDINHSETRFACTSAESVQMSLPGTFDWWNSDDLLQYFMSHKNLQVHSSSWTHWDLRLQSLHIDMLRVFSHSQQLYFLFRQSEQRNVRKCLCSDVRILWSFSRYCRTVWLELSDLLRVSNFLYELFNRHVFGRRKCLCVMFSNLSSRMFTMWHNTVHFMWYGVCFSSKRTVLCFLFVIRSPMLFMWFNRMSFLFNRVFPHFIKNLSVLYHIWHTMHWLWSINLFDLFSRIYLTKLHLSKSQPSLWRWSLDRHLIIMWWW